MQITAGELSKRTGITRRMALYILSGKQRPSAELAIKLEAATGTAREAWIWPDRYFNPYIRKAS